jgi:HEAT repeat protein
LDFFAAEMRDLEFEPAIPALAQVVLEGFGNVAAELLARFGDGAMPSLVAACKSKNSAERLNAVCGLERERKAAPVEVLLALLKDETPQVRLRAERLAHYSDPKEIH